MRRHVRIGAGALAAAALAGVGLAAPATAAPSSRATVTGSVPPWATSANFKAAAAASNQVGFRVYLGWRNSAQAEALARSVSTPGDPSYGKFLTPAQFRQQFAPTQSDVTAVQQWLRANGFTVDYTPANNHYVAAEGSIAQANAAFGTTLGTYSYQGKTLLAPEKPLTVPASLPNVSGVIGLDDSAELVHTDRSVGADAAPAPAFVNADPMSAYFGEKRVASDRSPHGTSLPTSPDYPYVTRGYTPAQLRGAYGLTDPTLNGSGVTVAIIDAYASPTIVQDANQYSTNRNEPTFTANQFRQVVAPGTFKRPENNRQDPQGWYGEETLDVEAVHAMAPGANIVYVGAPNNYQDLDAALNHVVDQKLATIVTNSYGWGGEALPYGFIKPQLDTMIQAVAEGIGVYFSSGDSGDETGGSGNLNQASADWPATSPWVTAVGGTSLAVGAQNNYLFENGWETGKSPLTSSGTWGSPKYTSGSGGGTSRLFSQPSYQQGVVPAAISQIRKGSAMRAVPDVSMVADPNTGFLMGQTQTFPDGSVKYSEYRIGGTSLSSPLFAGVMAVAQQKAGHAIGFANPALYGAYSSKAYRDVTKPTQAPADQAVVRVDYANLVDASAGYVYSLRQLGYDAPLTIHAQAGYDDVTGVGSPNGSAFLAAIGK